eukprot:3043930-Rhodomonas_salina.1
MGCAAEHIATNLAIHPPPPLALDPLLHPVVPPVLRRAREPHVLPGTTMQDLFSTNLRHFQYHRHRTPSHV